MYVLDRRFVDRFADKIDRFRSNIFAQGVVGKFGSVVVYLPGSSIDVSEDMLIMYI